jgi:hypothetical protein
MNAAQRVALRKRREESCDVRGDGECVSPVPCVHSLKCPTCGAPVVQTSSSTFPQYEPNTYKYVAP